MNIKKIFASVVASAMAVSAMAVAASADKVINSDMGFTDDGNGNYQLFLAGDNAISEAEGLDITKIAAVNLTFTFEDNGGEVWIGGKVVAQSDAVGWDELGEYENATGNGKKFEGVTSGKAFNVKLNKTFAAEDTYAAITLQTYGADFTVSALELLDASGNVLLALPAAAAPAAPAAPADDKGTPDTGVEGVAVIAALAILAGGAVVVAKKRK